MSKYDHLIDEYETDQPKKKGVKKPKTGANVRKKRNKQSDYRRKADRKMTKSKLKNTTRKRWK